uniref:Sorting nexin 17 n=4 Tax=Cercopithecidae TaxID=9527 RepID=A0A2K5N154_CERAT
MHFSIPETESRSGDSGGSAYVFGKTHCLGAARPSTVSCVGHNRRHSRSPQRKCPWKCCSATGRKFLSTC